MLRYIDGEWVNVSAKCKRQKSLGYYDNDVDDVNYSTDGGYDQLNKYEMDVNDGDFDDDDDDEDEVEDDCMPRYHNNRRPDSFWMGDGFQKQMCPRQNRSNYVSMRRHRIHQHGDDSDYGDERKLIGGNRMLHNRFSAFSSVTLIGKAIRNDAKPRSVRFMPHSQPMLPINRHSMFRGYHPYSRPAIAPPPPPPTSPRIEICDDPSKRIGVGNCCCCQGPPVVPMVNRKIEVMPVQIQWREKEQDQKQVEQNPSPSTTTTTTEIQQKSDELMPIIEIIDQTVEPESMKLKIEDDTNTN